LQIVPGARSLTGDLIGGLNLFGFLVFAHVCSSRRILQDLAGR
jgi:hypothetical protein